MLACGWPVAGLSLACCWPAAGLLLASCWSFANRSLAVCLRVARLLLACCSLAILCCRQLAHALSNHSSSSTSLVELAKVCVLFETAFTFSAQSSLPPGLRVPAPFQNCSCAKSRTPHSCSLWVSLSLSPSQSAALEYLREAPVTLDRVTVLDKTLKLADHMNMQQGTDLLQTLAKKVRA